MGEKEAKSKDMNACYIEVRSLADLCRFASGFTSEYTPMLFCFRDKDGLMLLSPGIKLGSSRTVFSLRSSAKGSPSFVLYRPGTATSAEAAEPAEKLDSTQRDRNTTIMPVVELMKNPFISAKEAPKVTNVKVKEIEMLVRASIVKAMEHSIIGRLYVFNHGGKRYAGSFSVLYLDDREDEDEIKIFTYAELKDSKEFNFFRYDYNSDKVEPTNVFGEHSFLYVRVINLADAPSFFKPE